MQHAAELPPLEEDRIRPARLYSCAAPARKHRVAEPAMQPAVPSVHDIWNYWSSMQKIQQLRYVASNFILED